MKALTSLYLAAAREFLRDRVAFLLTMLLPLVLAGFFGLIFSNEQSFHVNIGIAVEDTGPVGQELAKAFQSMGDSVTAHTGPREELMTGMKKGILPVVVVLPQDLTANVGAKKPTNIEVLWDKSQSSDAGPGLSVVRQMVQEANLKLMGGSAPLTLQETAVENRRIPMAQLYIPGMLSMALLWLGVFGVAPPLVQMREMQILRRLGATPLSRTTVMAAQVSFRLTAALAQAAVLLGFGVAAYGMKVQGNWFLLLAAILLGAMMLITLGFLLASVAKSNDAVVALGQIVQFPMMFLSGILFPLEMLPPFMRPVVDAMPLTYLADALKQIVLAAPPMFPLWVDFAVMGGCTLLFAGLSVKFFRWE